MEYIEVAAKTQNRCKTIFDARSDETFVSIPFSPPIMETYYKGSRMLGYCLNVLGIRVAIGFF